VIVPFQLRVRKNAKPDEIQGLAYIFVKMLILLGFLIFRRMETQKRPKVSKSKKAGQPNGNDSAGIAL
jgi:hypothetical protein